jgi:hypothetical protein
MQRVASPTTGYIREGKYRVTISSQVEGGSWSTGLEYVRVDCAGGEVNGPSHICG